MGGQVVAGRWQVVPLPIGISGTVDSYRGKLRNKQYRPGLNCVGIQIYVCVIKKNKSKRYMFHGHQHFSVEERNRINVALLLVKD